MLVLAPIILIPCPRTPLSTLSHNGYLLPPMARQCSKFYRAEKIRLLIYSLALLGALPAQPLVFNYFIKLDVCSIFEATLSAIRNFILLPNMRPWCLVLVNFVSSLLVLIMHLSRFLFCLVLFLTELALQRTKIPIALHALK